MIKHIFFIFLFFSTFFAEAQYNSQFNRRQNMRSRQPMATQKPRAPKINVEKAVGLIFYNIEKVSKKIGINFIDLNDCSIIFVAPVASNT